LPFSTPKNLILIIVGKIYEEIYNQQLPLRCRFVLVGGLWLLPNNKP